MEVKRECSCGGKYWPSQAWIHKGCVANAPVANETEQPVANKRKPGKYKDAEKRREYMRELMRKRRVKAAGT